MNTKLYAWSKYFVYLILLSTFLLLKVFINQKITSVQQLTFTYPKGLITVSFLLGIGIGMILGLEHLIQERKKEGKWSINYPKLILIGLPSLYFASYYILSLNHITFLYSFLYDYIYQVLEYTRLFQLIFGYILIASFYKKKADE